MRRRRKAEDLGVPEDDAEEDSQDLGVSVACWAPRCQHAR